jgi:hypothetical protein
MICKGLSQPKMGSFVLQVGELMQEQLKWRDHMISIGETAEEWLKTKLDGIQEKPSSSKNSRRLKSLKK